MSNLVTFSQFEAAQKDLGKEKFSIITMAGKKIVRYKLRDQAVAALKAVTPNVQIVDDLNNTLRARQDGKTYIEITDADLKSFVNGPSAEPGAKGKKRKSKDAEIASRLVEMLDYIQALLDDLKVGKERTNAIPYLRELRQSVYLGMFYQDRFSKLIAIEALKKHYATFKSWIYAREELTEDQKNLVMTLAEKALTTKELFYRPSATTALPPPKELADTL